MTMSISRTMSMSMAMSETGAVLLLTHENAVLTLFEKAPTICFANTSYDIDIDIDIDIVIDIVRT